MLNAGQKQALLLAMTPYLCLALYDGWLHERSRRVPLAEQAAHALLLVSLVTLTIGLFLDRPRWVLPAIIGFGVFTAADELGFHGGLPRRERLLHFAAYACFGGFCLVALRMGVSS